MKEKIMTLMLLIVSGMWTMSDALCIEYAPQNMQKPIQRFTGLLNVVNTPCETEDVDEDPCLPCLTLAFQVDSILYYLTSAQDDIRTLLEEQEENIPQNTYATICGIPYKNGVYNYLNVIEFYRYNEPICLVSESGQEKTYVEELTGILTQAQFPCEDEEDCPDCLTYVLRTKDRKQYYLTGSPMEEIVKSDTFHLRKVVVSGMMGSAERYEWLRVDKIRLSEEPLTTNINTWGYVENEAGKRLEGIRIIVHDTDNTICDTVYSGENGLFSSLIRDILYPVKSMNVTVDDVSGRYETQTISTTYIYECGFDFNPETDIASNEEEILFVLKEKTSEAIDNIPSELPTAAKLFHDGQILILRDGKVFTITGQTIVVR